MFILKKGHQPGVYVPLRALFLVFICNYVDAVRRSFLFLLVVRIGCVILLFHSLGLQYNYFSFINQIMHINELNAIV